MFDSMINQQSHTMLKDIITDWRSPWKYAFKHIWWYFALNEYSPGPLRIWSKPSNGRKPIIFVLTKNGMKGRIPTTAQFTVIVDTFSHHSTHCFELIFNKWFLQESFCDWILVYEYYSMYPDTVFTLRWLLCPKIFWLCVAVKSAL